MNLCVVPWPLKEPFQPSDKNFIKENERIIDTKEEVESMLYVQNHCFITKISQIPNWNWWRILSYPNFPMLFNYFHTLSLIVDNGEFLVLSWM